MPTSIELSEQLTATEKKLAEQQAAREATLLEFGNDAGWGAVIIATHRECERLEAELAKKSTAPLRLPRGTSDEDACLMNFIEGQCDDGWELLNDDAQITLQKNPDDEHAYKITMQYQNRLKQRKRGIVTNLTINKFEPIELIHGTWIRKDGVYCVRIQGAQTGETVTVRALSGETQEVVLGEQIGKSLFRPR